MNAENTPRQEFLAGLKDTFPLVVGAAPFAVIFGALATASGLSPAAAMGMSLFVFAGSAQFIGVGLFSQNAGIAVIIATTFIVNLRHALYGASLAPYVRHLSQRWLLLLGYWLTDETYAVVIRHYQQQTASPHRHWYFFGSSLLMYFNWQFWTVVGIVTGRQFGDLASLGLDFAMVVTFIGIVVPLVRGRPMLICALVAGLTSLVANGLPNRLGLMVAALAGITAGIIAESRVEASASALEASDQ